MFPRIFVENSHGLPYKELKSNRKVSDSIGNNYSPFAKDLNLEILALNNTASISKKILVDMGELLKEKKSKLVTSRPQSPLSRKRAIHISKAIDDRFIYYVENLFDEDCICNFETFQQLNIPPERYDDFSSSQKWAILNYLLLEFKECERLVMTSYPPSFPQSFKTHAPWSSKLIREQFKLPFFYNTELFRNYFDITTRELQPFEEKNFSLYIEKYINLLSSEKFLLETTFKKISDLRLQKLIKFSALNQFLLSLSQSIQIKNHFEIEVVNLESDLQLSHDSTNLRKDVEAFLNALNNFLEDMNMEAVPELEHHLKIINLILDGMELEFKDLKQQIIENLRNVTNLVESCTSFKETENLLNYGERQLDCKKKLRQIYPQSIKSQNFVIYFHKYVASQISRVEK
eukprot:NODE_35_length_36362_cov_0.944434.p9 type:complete len:403 gc:universal NODE_35_length_36362_cov_0.944434:31337-32545(+)